MNRGSLPLSLPLSAPSLPLSAHLFGCSLSRCCPDGARLGGDRRHTRAHHPLLVCPKHGLQTKPALCHPDLRTYNVNASCGGPTDWYQFAPWRAPGHAPVFDSCGMAGGTPHRGDYGAQYFDTRFARQGDLGSKVLKPRKTGVVWTAGSTVEVSWAIEANHGGGYQYRLCKADDPLGLVEDCFIKHPLPFTNGQRLRWGGKHGRVEAIEGRLASDGPPKVGNYTGRIFTDVKVPATSSPSHVLLRWGIAARLWQRPTFAVPRFPTNT